jgi:UDP-glucose:glycoprotein glucosyltransferase
MEAEKLLPDADGGGDGGGAAAAIAKKASGGLFGGSKAAAPRAAADDVINVFTVASGHMYERLQKIMILSVIKNTKSRWGGGMAAGAGP